MSKVKLVVTVPQSHADAVREAIGNVGGGRIGNYEFCSFSTKGIGRFRPLRGANPAIGSVGELESVTEARIEITIDHEILSRVVDAIRMVHPYEEIALDIYTLEKPLE